MEPTTGRPYLAGDRFGVSGLDFKVVGGRKSRGDLKLLWSPEDADEWVAFEMAVGGHFAAFFRQNEDNLAARKYGGNAEGGEFYLRYLRRAAEVGQALAAEEFGLTDTTVWKVMRSLHDGLIQPSTSCGCHECS